MDRFRMYKSREKERKNRGLVIVTLYPTMLFLLLYRLELTNSLLLSIYLWFVVIMIMVVLFSTSQILLFERENIYIRKGFKKQELDYKKIKEAHCKPYTHYFTSIIPFQKRKEVKKNSVIFKTENGESMPFILQGYIRNETYILTELLNNNPQVKIKNEIKKDKK